MGCAYRMGSPDRSLPGGYKQMTVPIFKNFTQEPGIEVYFTNSLIQEFERSRIARITDPAKSEVLVEGEILDVTYTPGGKKEGSTLPTGAVLATLYTIKLRSKITLRRQADRSVLWEGNFETERDYSAPQVSAAGINTVNPLYNLAARRQNIQSLATELMSEAHSRITENF